MPGKKVKDRTVYVYLPNERMLERWKKVYELDYHFGDWIFSR